MISYLHIHPQLAAILLAQPPQSAHLLIQLHLSVSTQCYYIVNIVIITVHPYNQWQFSTVGSPSSRPLGNIPWRCLCASTSVCTDRRPSLETTSCNALAVRSICQLAVIVCMHIQLPLHISSSLSPNDLSDIIFRLEYKEAGGTPRHCHVMIQWSNLNG